MGRLLGPLGCHSPVLLPTPRGTGAAEGGLVVPFGHLCWHRFLGELPAAAALQDELSV